jgi:hypothetical protein
VLKLLYREGPTVLEPGLDERLLDWDAGNPIWIQETIALDVPSWIALPVLEWLHH